MLTLDPSKVPGYVKSVIITWSINYNYNYYKLCSPSIYPSKVPDHLQIKIKMPNPSQEPPASSKALNEDLKEMCVLCTFKIKIESQNSTYGCTKDK